MDLQQSTAYVHQFLLVDNVSHVNGKTGLGSAVTIKIKQPGFSTITGAGTVTEVDTANLPGVYSYAFQASDLANLGDLSFQANGTGTDFTNEFHRVVQNLLNNVLAINASGQVFIASNVKQGQPFVLPFLMTVNGVPTPSLGGFNAQRSLAGAGFAPCVNTVSEIGGAGNGAGNYALLMAAADSAAAVIQVHITASGADDRNITVYMQP